MDELQEAIDQLEEIDSYSMLNGAVSRAIRVVIKAAKAQQPTPPTPTREEQLIESLQEIRNVLQGIKFHPTYGVSIIQRTEEVIAYLKEQQEKPKSALPYLDRIEYAMKYTGDANVSNALSQVRDYLRGQHISTSYPEMMRKP